jgi:trypsin
MFTIYLGLHDKSELETSSLNVNTVAMNASNVFVHENYSSSDYSNDIALLFLPTNVTLNNYIQIACLPKESSNTYPGTNVSVYAAGWGTLSSGGNQPDKLQNVKLTAYPASSCTKVNQLTNGQICAGLYSGGKDTCQGDSGGPLYYLDNVNSQSKYVVSGVVSYGIGCGDATFPGVYTRVSFYLNWIKHIKSIVDSAIIAEPVEEESPFIKFLKKILESICQGFQDFFDMLMFWN